MTLPFQSALEGKYEILDKIGEGGIGSVYKVRHRLLQEERVIKVLRPQAAADAELQERFLHEARMAIRLKHPGIAQLHDFSITEDGFAYIVMEYIDGVALNAMLRAAGPPSLEMTLEVCRQALASLAYLHSRQFVHRDVSPDNLMLTSAYDGSPKVKLIDLGIAKNLGGDLHLTATGVFVGKVRYSSPEQFSAQGAAELDHRCDIYSFGVMLYELLTGEYPFAGESFSEVAAGHLFQAPRPFKETDPKSRVPDGLRNVILCSLEKEPERRLPDAEEFLNRLDAFGDAETDLKDELREIVETTSASLPSLRKEHDGGSTQSRLNREFGMVTTPSPQQITEVAEGETVAVASGAPAGATPAATVAAEKRGGTLRWILPSAAIVIASAALAAVIWFVRSGSLGGSGIAESAVKAGTIEVALTEAWSAASQVESTLVLTGIEPPAGEGEEEVGRTADSQTGTAPVSAEPEDATPAEDRRISEADTSGADASSGPTSAASATTTTTTTADGAEPRTTTEVYSLGIGVVPPVLLELPEAVHPDANNKREVVVIIRVLVAETGEVMSAAVIRGPSFKKRLRERALEVARGAKFRPASKDGVAGRMWSEVRVVFPPSERA